MVPYDAPRTLAGGDGLAAYGHLQESLLLAYTRPFWLCILPNVEPTLDD